MDRVRQKIEELISAIKDTDEYREYVELEHELQDRPTLKKKIDSYRLKVFEMQTSDRDLYEETDYVLREYGDLMKDRLAANYLDSESAVCRMIQQTVDAINAEVSVKLPQA